MKYGTETLGNESSIQIPDEIWQAICSHLPFRSLSEMVQVNKNWLQLIQDLTRQRMRYYFPYLQIHPDYKDAPLKLFIQEYQYYQRLYPNLPITMAEILSALAGEVKTNSFEKKPHFTMVLLYALSVSNGHSLPEAEMKEEDITDINGLALGLAARNENVAVFKKLFALSKISDDDKTAALLYATEDGKLNDCVEMLIKDPGTQLKAIALESAAEHGHLSVVNELLRMPEMLTSNKAIALYLASANGHVDIVNVFLALPEFANRDNSLALLGAAKNGHYSVVNALLTGPGILSDKNRALIGAAKNGHAAIIKILLAQPEISYQDKRKAYQAAVQNGHLLCSKILANHLKLNTKRYWEYIGLVIGAAVGIMIGTLYPSIIFIICNSLIFAKICSYLAGVCFERRQDHLYKASQNYNSSQKVDAVTDPDEQKALKIGMEAAKNWKGYFRSFTRKEGYYFQNAFKAGMTFAMDENKEMIAKINSIKIPCN